MGDGVVLLQNRESHYVGGILNIGGQGQEDYFYVWVTGIWDPDSAGLAGVGVGNWTGNGTEAGDGGVGARVDVT